MLYDQIPQTGQITVSKEHGPSYTFKAEPFDPKWCYRVPFGNEVTQNCGRASGDIVPEKGAARIINLLTCAAVSYIYTDTASKVVKVVLYHAHTGMIPKTEWPTDGKYMPKNMSTDRIHVVFASSQSPNPSSPLSGIESAADGLIDLQQGANIPTANIRVVTGTGARVGVSSEGDVGLVNERFWASGDLTRTLTDAADDALNDYKTQFPKEQSTMGFLGSSHNKDDGVSRITQLKNSISNVANDEARLSVLRRFFNSGYSFKDGSLKLFLVKKLIASIRPTYVTAVTSSNAKMQSITLIDGIEMGHW